MAEAIRKMDIEKVAKLGPAEARDRDMDKWIDRLEEFRTDFRDSFQGPDSDNKTGVLLEARTGFRSVEEMRTFIDDYDKSGLASKKVNRDKYEKALEDEALLSQSIYVLVDDEFGWKSTITAEDIDGWLPSSLRGLGEAISLNLVSSPELKSTLKAIDAKFDGVVFTDWAGVDEYENFLGRMEESISRMGAEVGADQNFIDERARVMDFIDYKMSEARQAKKKLDRFTKEAVPTDPAEQLSKMRETMSYIEDSGYGFGDLMVSHESGTILAYLDSKDLAPEVRKEIIARLHVNNVYQLMYAAGGFMDDRIPGSIPNAMQRIFDGHGELSFADLTFFLRDGANGMETGYFWDKLMDINYQDGYARKVTEIMGDTAFIASLRADTGFWKNNGLDPAQYLTAEAFGKVGTDSLNPGSTFFSGEKSNYQYDSDSVRKEIVRKYLVAKKGGDKGLLSKGLEFADKLIVATGEDATMNAAFAGHHDLAELILTEANTFDRKSKGKTIGSRRAMRSLISLTPTWLRAISEKSCAGPLKCADINFAALNQPKGSEYFYYTAILVKKIIPYQKAVMEEGVDIKSILTNSYWRSMFDCINKVAKYPSIVVDAKRDKDGNVLRYNEGLEAGTEVLDLIYLQDGSVDWANSKGVMVMFNEPKPARTATAQEKKDYKDRKDAFYARKEARLREILVEGIVHLAAQRPELGMSLTQLKQLGTMLERGFVTKDFAWGGTVEEKKFLTEQQFGNIFEAYKKGVKEAVGSRKVTKREQSVEDDDKTQEVAGQVIKTLTK